MALAVRAGAADPRCTNDIISRNRRSSSSTTSSTSEGSSRVRGLPRPRFAGGLSRAGEGKPAKAAPAWASPRRVVLSTGRTGTGRSRRESVREPLHAPGTPPTSPRPSTSSRRRRSSPPPVRRGSSPTRPLRGSGDGGVALHHWSRRPPGTGVAIRIEPLDDDLARRSARRRRTLARRREAWVRRLLVTLRRPATAAECGDATRSPQVAELVLRGGADGCGSVSSLRCSGLGQRRDEGEVVRATAARLLGRPRSFCAR